MLMTAARFIGFAVVGVILAVIWHFLRNLVGAAIRFLVLRFLKKEKVNFVVAENMKYLRAHGVIVCLTADVDTILARTSMRGQRPVLDGQDTGDRRAAIEQLLAERAGLYAGADYTVDTSEWSPLQVVDDIVKYLRGRGALHE